MKSSNSKQEVPFLVGDLAFRSIVMVEGTTAMESVPKEIATLGGGCFWCLEAVLEQLRGVERVESGYSGGNRVDPSYQEVCAGDTGHAEVIQDHLRSEGHFLFGKFLRFFSPSTTRPRPIGKEPTWARSIVR